MTPADVGPFVGPILATQGQSVPGIAVGYLVPEFPGQTHIMFWRELQQLWSMSVAAEPVTTRRPRAGRQVHRWSIEADQRTVVLTDLSAGDVVSAGWLVVRSGPYAWKRVVSSMFRSDGQLRDRAALLAALALGAHLCAVSRRRGWQHVHVHSCARAADIVWYSRLFGGPPYSLTLHGPVSDYGPDQDRKWSAAAFGIVITETLRDELEAQLGEAAPTLHVCGMGADPARLERPTPYRPWDGEHELVVFSCGRLNPAKGHADLVSAVGRLVRAGLPIRLRIAGEDEHGGEGYRRDLERHVADQGLGGHVDLLGAVPEETVIAELHRCHLFALASHAEPLGVAVMEAMAAGVPVVTTRAGGIPELVTDGSNGLLVPPERPDELADALRSLALDPVRASLLAAAARTAAERRAERESSAEVLVNAIRAVTRP